MPATVFEFDTSETKNWPDAPGWWLILEDNVEWLWCRLYLAGTLTIDDCSYDDLDDYLKSGLNDVPKFVGPFILKAKE